MLANFIEFAGVQVAHGAVVGASPLLHSQPHNIIIKANNVLTLREMVADCLPLHHNALRPLAHSRAVLPEFLLEHPLVLGYLPVVHKHVHPGHGHLKASQLRQGLLGQELRALVARHHHNVVLLQLLQFGRADRGGLRLLPLLGCPSRVQARLPELRRRRLDHPLRKIQRLELRLQRLSRPGQLKHHPPDLVALRAPEQRRPRFSAALAKEHRWDAVVDGARGGRGVVYEFNPDCPPLLPDHVPHVVGAGAAAALARDALAVHCCDVHAGLAGQLLPMHHMHHVVRQAHRLLKCLRRPKSVGHVGTRAPQQGERFVGAE
mmetsp:Transcript_56493/g.123805  ORF Transcript_56493/g.123805 Transcript_56493/m.123805 type:complete len:319 (-) Transcript_56493:496-1452(-)